MIYLGLPYGSTFGWGVLGKEIALGYIKRGANEAGTRLVARSAVGRSNAVEVVELPFR
jgi:glycine cleavage system aminomethyltransferase T